MNHLEAKALVEAVFAHNAEPELGPTLVVDEATRAKPYGFVLLVNSRRFLETKERRYSLIGAGPIVVDTTRGNVVMLPTCYSVDDCITKYERGELNGQLLLRL